ncbi:GNAT family N-acetyltransferase [Halobacillus amylolyticus]|uniref:N-acetyltransferase n=1 Tax=Halobacillus amylolyticus TaxID=2932259 RepID=A0ABY4H7R0_9BACI|nr:GNAT family N-acetyltransferase [Halobacillus amylolyticus]UOR10483.1 N-acetyltransferase [Halobacillus amylolyticus]
MKDIIKKGDQFIAKEEGELIAEISVVPAGSDQLIVDHTFVSEERRGEGIGEKLIKEVVQFARNEGKTIIPLCSFTKSVIDRNENHQDVLAK